MAQAMYWKQAFRSVPIDSIYSSTLKRCRHTAELIAGRKKVTAVDALSEINLGTWENKTFDDIKKNKPNQFKDRGENPDTFTPPDGENFLDVQNRIIPFFNRLSGADKNILIITHAGVIRVLLTRLSGGNLKQIFKIPLSYSELIVLKNSPSGIN